MTKPKVPISVDKIVDDAFQLVSENFHPGRRFVWIDGFKFFVHDSVLDEEIVDLLFNKKKNYFYRIEELDDKR